MRADGDELELVFVPDGQERAVGVHVRQRGTVVEGVPTADGAAEQLRRILGLDVDGAGFAAVAERDPVVADLQQRWPGFRPVSFPSPFEAGAWFLISQRTPHRRALELKERLAAELGEAAGELTSFPPPAALVELGAFPGLPDVKRKRLQALAQAAVDGRLSGARLRAMAPDAALAALQAIPGVGPFTAQGILVRGANEPDWLPTAEPRLARAVEGAYGPGQDLDALAERWRPYRSWAAVMLRRTLE
jgi:DNA-3-methyladenine glycosylase II